MFPFVDAMYQKQNIERIIKEKQEQMEGADTAVKRVDLEAQIETLQCTCATLERLDTLLTTLRWFGL